MAGILFTDKNFEEQTSISAIPVLVDFWAAWCPPCRLIDPIMEELAKEYEGRVIFGKVDADENPELVEKFSVMSMPTVVIIKDGQPKKALIGAQAKETYKEMIEEIISL